MLNKVYLTRSSSLKFCRRLLSFSSSSCSQNSSPVFKTGHRKTHYEVLGLKRDANAADIRAAFVCLSKEIHPDKNPDDPDNHSKFVMLNEAYTVLSKPQSRREYDVSLAHWLYLRQVASRAGYTSHTAGGGPSPGSGSKQESYDGDLQQQRPFWDETIWYMRDRSRDADAFYPEDSYYGIRGIRRQPNSTIVAICLVLVAVGTVYFFAAFRYTTMKHRERLEAVDRKNLRVLRETQERARLNGTVKQLAILAGQRPTAVPPRVILAGQRPTAVPSALRQNSND